MFFYGILAGINSGILNALMFVTTMQLFGNDKGKYIWGYINVMLALGMMIGPVMAGGIYDATQSYDVTFFVSSAIFVKCGIVMGLIPYCLKRWPMDNDYDDVEIIVEKQKPIYRRHNKKQQKHENNGGKWGDDVNMHLKTLTAIDEEVKQQQQEEIENTD